MSQKAAVDGSVTSEKEEVKRFELAVFLLPLFSLQRPEVVSDLVSLPSPGFPLAQHVSFQASM